MNTRYAVHAELAADDRTVVVMGAGDAATIVDHLRTLTPTFRAGPSGTLTTAVSWPLVIQLAGQFPGAYVPGPRLTAWTHAEVVRRTQPATGPVAGLELRASAPEPREYQWSGGHDIARTGRALIFDDPGTGKTLTAILGVLMLRARGELPADGPIVVVCPNSVQDAWVTAWQRWTTLAAVAYRGVAGTRRRLLGVRSDGRPHAGVFVVGYGTVRRDADPSDRRAPLRELAPAAVIVDECHGIKNPQSVQSRAVRSLCRSASAVVAMSGTPITHHTGDLWASLNATHPDAFPSGERYKARYLLTVQGDYSDTVLGIDPAADREFRTVLLGAHRRVSKADVLTQLPPQVYSVRTIDVPPAYRKAYDDMESDMLATLPDGTALTAMTVLAQLSRLAQLSASDCDVTVEYEETEDEFGMPITKEHVHATPKAPCWKGDEMLAVLSEREKVAALVFAPFAGLIRVAGAMAEKAGYRVGYIIGGQTAAARTAVVDQFQAGELDVVMATTGAGGVGLTLTAADLVIFLQRPWSYVDAVQAEGRAHRIGSEVHDSIDVVDIVARNTIDERMRSVITDKAANLAELFADPRIVSTVLGGDSVHNRQLV